MKTAQTVTKKSAPTESQTAADANSSAFDLAEFDALRREIELHIAERRKIENQVILGLAAIYSWLFTRDATFPAYLFKAGLAIPALMVFLGFVRWMAIQLRTMKLGEYLSGVEVGLSRKKTGWEHFLANHRTERPIMGQFEGWSEIVVWSALFGVSFLVLIYIPAPNGSAETKIGVSPTIAGLSVATPEPSTKSRPDMQTTIPAQ